ncbi:MAG: hypothetical protein ACYDHT_00560 [Solirubrobacteraceae bacterium]
MATEAIVDAPTLAEELSTAAPVKAPEVKAAAESATDGGKAAKGKKGKEEKGKGKKGKADAEVAGEDTPSIVGHPRAARAVARAKGWGGLFGFLLGGYLSLPTATPADAGLRALLAGIVCYVVAWAGAVFAWRRIVVIEIKAREQKLHSARAELEAGVPAGSERPRARAGG